MCSKGFFFEGHEKVEVEKRLLNIEGKGEKLLPFMFWLNGALSHFQNYFSHMVAAAHIFMCFLGITCTRLELWDDLPKDTPMVLAAFNPLPHNPDFSRP